MSYELKLEKFSGPIETLLDLIERKKLEITEFSLAEVTADFLNYLQKVEEAHPRLLADFVVVASRLLLIKSRALLPNLELTTEEEKDIKELEVQLKFYQNFKPAIAYLKRLWEANSFSASRPLMAGRMAVFYPTDNISLDNLLKSMSAIFQALEEMAVETKTIKTSLVSIEEKIQEIMDLVSKAQNFQFKEINKDKPRSEIIIMFLALLQLINSQLIEAEQKKHFSDINIGRNHK